MQDSAEDLREGQVKTPCGHVSSLDDKDTVLSFKVTFGFHLTAVKGFTDSPRATKGN